MKSHVKLVDWIIAGDTLSNFSQGTKVTCNAQNSALASCKAITKDYMKHKPPQRHKTLLDVFQKLLKIEHPAKIPSLQRHLSLKTKNPERLVILPVKYR